MLGDEMKVNVDFGRILTSIIILGILAVIKGFYDLQVTKAAVNVNQRSILRHNGEILTNGKKVDEIHWYIIRRNNVKVPNKHEGE